MILLIAVQSAALSAAETAWLSQQQDGQKDVQQPRPFAHNGTTERPCRYSSRDNNVDQALRALKRKMQREGIFREMKMRGHYEKPSEKRAREKAEAVRRARK